MISRIAKWKLFTFAYLPVFCFLIILHIKEIYQIIGLLLIICSLVVLITTLFFKKLESLPSQNPTIEVKSKANHHYLTVIVSYLVPFFIPITGWRTGIVLALMLVLIGYFYTHSNLFSINPLLKLVFRINIYEVSHGKQQYYLLTTHHHNFDIIKIHGVFLDSDVIWEKNTALMQEYKSHNTSRTL